jgi:hypothetical protein
MRPVVAKVGLGAADRDAAVMDWLRHGKSRPGLARPVVAVEAEHGRSSKGLARCGSVGRSRGARIGLRFGAALGVQGTAVEGSIGLARSGPMRLGGGPGSAGRVGLRLGSVCCGLGWAVRVRRDAARLCQARLGMARWGGRGAWRLGAACHDAAGSGLVCPGEGGHR